MGKGRSKKPPQDTGTGDPGFGSPFAGLKDLRDDLPAGDAPAPEAPAEAASGGAPEPPSRAVIRYQRKGRGGKEVTLVEQLGLPPQDLARWLNTLKRALGCGGAVEGDVLILQGDQRGRLPGLLEGEGVGRISVS